MQTMDKVQCSNCKCWRLSDAYIGKSGAIVKRCVKCRDKDAKSKKRPDVIQKRNQRQRDKKYYVKYRDKKRNENKEEFLKHNAIMAKKWRDTHKEHLSAWRTKHFVSRLTSIKQQAQKKGIIWNDNLTDDICYTMMTSECYYCRFISDNTLNGIDRMDGMGSYEESNCVGCCKNCNFIKGSLDPLTFIKRCRHVAKNFSDIGEYNYDIWADTKSVSYKMYERRALEKQIDFNLNHDQYTNLISGVCFYCAKRNTLLHQNGIDRKDSKQGYTVDNCVTCCGQCNYMKGSLSNVEYVECCVRISQHSLHLDMEVLNTIPQCTKHITKRPKHEVVKKKIVVINLQANRTEVREKQEEQPASMATERVSSNGSNLSENVENIQLPKYCYYVPATKEKGDGFCCGRLHPKHTKDWTTTKSRKVSIHEKYKQLMAYLEDKDYQPVQDVEIPKRQKKESITITPEEKFALLSEDQLIEIINMKHEAKTTQEASDYIKEHYNGICISRNFVSKLWNDEVALSKELKESDAYGKMLANKKQRTAKSRKFSEDELLWLASNNLDKSSSERAKLFESKFNKTITPTYIIKLSC